jgi:hypothetical protein
MLNITQVSSLANPNGENNAYTSTAFLLANPALNVLDKMSHVG